MPNSFTPYWRANEKEIISLIDSINDKSSILWITKTGRITRWNIIIKFNKPIFDKIYHNLTLVPLYPLHPIIYIFNGFPFTTYQSSLITLAIEDYFQKPIQDLF